MFDRSSGVSNTFRGDVPEILTARLALIAVTANTLHSEKAADGRLGELIRCAVPANWPPVDWEPHVMDMVLAQFDRDPTQVGWHRYVGLVRPDGSRLLIGSLGAFWRQAAPTECEIGYTILPPYEGQGLATEAARGLLGLLREDGRLRSVVAHTFPRLVGSIRVMEKCGFVPDGDGEEPGTVRYRLQV